jgi:hypothetical protein
LVSGNFPRPVDSIGLAVEELRGALGSGALDGPSVLTGDHMLIAFGHVDHLVAAKLLLICMFGKESKRGQIAYNVRGGEKLRTYQ